MNDIGPLIVRLNLPAVDAFHSQGNKSATVAKIKATGDSKDYNSLTSLTCAICTDDMYNMHSYIMTLLSCVH